MNFKDCFPEPELILNSDVEELALKILPALAFIGSNNTSWLNCTSFVNFAIKGGYNNQHHNYPGYGVDQLKTPLCEAYYWLLGQALLVPRDEQNPSYHRLSRKAEQLASAYKDASQTQLPSMPQDRLHLSIREDVWSLYHRRKFDTAVFEAMKAVEVAVRDAANFGDEMVGVKLVRAAFAPFNGSQSGPLTDLMVEYAEQEARAHLFAGAVGAFKNPHSHRNVNLSDPEEAAEIIWLANHLLRIVDYRKKLPRDS